MYTLKIQSTNTNMLFIINSHISLKLSPLSEKGGLTLELIAIS